MALYLDAGPSNYKSGAIRVVKSTDLDQDAATPVLDVVPGTPEPFQKLQALVNSSTPVTGNNGVKVQVWAQALGTGNSPYLLSFGGAAGVEMPAGAGVPIPVAGTQTALDRDWNQSHGLGTVVTDPANQAAVDQVNALLAGGTEFHCCIKANVFAINNNTDAVVEGVRLPAAPTLDFSDPRQAQRNMTIKTHATGTAMVMLMFAGNTDDQREQRIRLRVIDRPLRRLPRLEFAELAAIAPWMRTTRKRFGPGFVPGLEVVVDDKRSPIRFAERPLDDLALEIEGKKGPKIEIELPPEKSLPMLMHAGLDKEDFVLRAFDVAQIERDEVVGEAHVLLLSVPEELAERPERAGKTGA